MNSNRVATAVLAFTLGACLSCLYLLMPSFPKEKVDTGVVVKENPRAHKVDVCSEMFVYIDKVNNVCWVRSGYAGGAIGFQISCDSALRCLKQ